MTDFPKINDTMIYVYLLPDPLNMANGYCFSGPVPIEFGNVDWFQGFDGMTEDDLRQQVSKKLYIKPSNTYLVCSPDNDMAFFIKGES